MKKALGFFAGLILSIPVPGVYAQEASGDLFNFEPDIRVFTAHAMMNAAGFTGEWRKEGMHPFRREVRAQLFSSLDSTYLKKLNDFYEARDGGNWSQWASAALLTDGPPSFTLKPYDKRTTTYDQDTESSVAAMTPSLAEFYLRARIPELWRRYRPQLQAFNNEFRPYAHQALEGIIAYCGLSADYFTHQVSRIHVLYSPLMSYYTAQTDKVNGEIFLVLGPQDSKPSTASFYHEALHHVVTPLTEKLDSATTKRFDQLFKLGSSGGHIGYSHFDEGFVRTLSCILSGKQFGYSDSTVLARVMNEYKLGFVLCPAIYEQLKRYESSQSTFVEYFPKIIAGIDIRKEVQRWNDFSTEKR